MLMYFCVRKYDCPGNGEWYDVRTEDSWVSMIHEEDTSIDEGVFACCAWSATQQGAKQGPVWPIAKAFTDLTGAVTEMGRSQKLEPDFNYRIVEIRADFIDL